MATYLQGVTDYIPQFQPFQPDLNFYANVMQTKQTQYDSNWKALNKMYGQYYHADLTRDGNVAKRDAYLKNAEFQLKRVSQLDLSLEQNVTQATQIFKPFYEDKNLMKDMAWTKNFNNQANRAEIFRNSIDPEDQKQYWEDGVKGMHYLKDEFKEASDEEALGFQNAEYVPYVNVIEKAQKIAKEADLSVEKVDFSPDGRWIIKTKNGEALTEPLQKLFEAQLGSDPGVQAVYKMQAYVNRKDYAYGNAGMFGGDKVQAEMKYLENSFNVLKEKSDLRYKQLQASSDVYDRNIKDLETQIANKTASPDAKALLAQYKMNKDINDKVLARAEEEQNTLNGGKSSTATTSGGFSNPYGDLKTLRWKVDNGMASMLMQKDLDEAANIFAYKDAEMDLEANPYKILEEKQRNSMQLIAAREQSSMRVAQFKDALSKVKDAEDAKIENGTHYRDDQGNLVPYDEQNYVRTEPIKAGSSLDESNMRSQSKRISNMTKEQYLDPYMSSTFAVLDQAIKSGKITKQEVSNILGFGKNKNITFDQFKNNYQKYGDAWVRKTVGTDGISSIRNKMNGWVANHRELDIFTANGDKTNLYKQYRTANTEMNDYLLYMKADKDWRIKTSKQVEAQLMKEGNKYAYLLYNEKGEVRSKKEFHDMLIKGGHISEKDLKAFNESIADEKSREAFGKVAEQMGKTPGSNIGTTWGLKLLRNLDKIGPGNWIGGAIDEAMMHNMDYDKLLAAANKHYANGKIIKANPVRIGKGPSSGTGLSSVNASTITVNPKGQSPGKAHFGEVLNDLKNFDWGSDKVSFAGISRDAFDNYAGGSRNDIGKRLLEDLQKEMNNPKSKIGTFDITVAPIAADKGNKGAVIIKMSKEFLDKYKSTDTDGKNNLLTQTQYNYLLKNGMSLIMDNSKMHSTLYKQSYTSPLQAYIDQMGKYELTNIGGDPKKSYTIVPNKIGTGDYTTIITFPKYDPETGKTTKETYVNNVGFQGSLLESNRDQMLNYFDQVDAMNTYLYNNYTEQ